MSESHQIDMKRLFQAMGAKEVELMMLKDKISELFQEVNRLKVHITELQNELDAHENH
jgi:hypothetical protein